MKITFIGTGTSHGVPVIGCHCEVCTSKNPKNKRSRCGILIQKDEQQILIDTPPELRLQAIKYGIERVDAAVFTHPHADHVFGFDDLRRFNHLSGEKIPCYGSADTLEALQKMFFYVFTDTPYPYAKPRVELREINGPFAIGSLNLIPIPVKHGEMNIYGYRFGNTAYLTDTSFIPESSLPLLENLDLLILGVLRYKYHPTHFNLEQALAAVKKINPRRTLFTHLSHAFDHDKVNSELPTHIQLAYDGLSLEL